MRKTVFLILTVFSLAICVSAKTTGGIVRVDKNDALVGNATLFVRDSANADECGGLCVNLTSNGKLKDIKVKSATSQIVAGALLRLDLVAKNEHKDKIAINATVLYRPWGSTADTKFEIQSLSYRFIKIHKMFRRLLAPLT